MPLFNYIHSTPKLSNLSFSHAHIGMTEHRADHINNFHDVSKLHFTYEQEKKFQIQVDNYYDTCHDSLLKSISNFKNSIEL